MDKDNEFKHKVVVLWNPHLKKDTYTYWNEVVAYGMETFGLPGVNYITHSTDEGMEWYFKEAADALFFRLKFAEVVR